MGFPLTTYTTLQALVEDEPGYERDRAHEVLAPFNLFAFVLHDPAAHPEFDAVMREDFDRFDYETGDKLLFLSLVNPNPEWLGRYRSRSYYEPLREVARPGRAAEADVLAAVASSFGLSPEDLPCLVVLPDLRASEFVWVRACPEHVGTQLSRLGYIADRSPGAWSSPETLRQLDLCSGTDFVEVGRQAASVLLDLFAFADLNPDDMVQRRTHERRAAFFRGFTAGLDEARRTSPALVERLAEQFLNAVGLSRSPRILEPPVQGLEPESERIYRSSIVAERALEYSSERGVLRQFGPGGADYSPPAIGLAKVFEREANLSVVHWARRELGIGMPAFFNRYAPGVKARVDRANFNGEKRGRWSPPPMGTARRGCQVYADQSGSWPDLHGESEWDALLAVWNDVTMLRNDVAHDRPFTRGDLADLKRSFRELEGGGHWGRIVALKSALRGGASVPDTP